MRAEDDRTPSGGRRVCHLSGRPAAGGFLVAETADPVREGDLFGFGVAGRRGRFLGLFENRVDRRTGSLGLGGQMNDPRRDVTDTLAQIRLFEMLLAERMLG